MHGLRTGIVDSGEADRRDNVMKRKAFVDGDDECEEEDENERDVFNFRVLSGVVLSLEQHPILICPAPRLLMDSVDMCLFDWVSG